MLCKNTVIKMKELYSKPNIEITLFDCDDVVCTSAEIANPDFAPDVDLGNAYKPVDALK